MRKLLFSVFFLSAIAHRLNKVENDNLQATCGQAFLQSGLVYSRSHCTGTIISPRHVLTAAHCFALNGYPKWYTLNEAVTFLFSNGNITQDFVPVHVNNGMKVAFKLNYFIITAPTICNDSTVLCDSHLEPVALQPKRVYLAKSWMNHFCSKPVNGKIRGDVAVMELEDDIVFSSTVQSACIHATRPSTGQVLFLYGYGVDSTQYLETAGILRKYQGTTLSEDKYGLATFSTSLSHHMNWIRAVTGIRPDGQSHMEDEDIETLMKEVYVIEQHPSFAIEIPRPFPGNEN